VFFNSTPYSGEAIMYRKKSIAISLSTLLITLNSSALLAADNTDGSSLPPYWPLIALFLIIIIFRKQLNCVPAPDLREKPKTENNITEPEPEPENAIIISETSATPINLKENSNQCQASTAKGTRCKRTTSLEDASISIDDKTYLLTVCKQHNKKNLKPFSELFE